MIIEMQVFAITPYMISLKEFIRTAKLIFDIISNTQSHLAFILLCNMIII